MSKIYIQMIVLEEKLRMYKQKKTKFAHPTTKFQSFYSNRKSFIKHDNDTDLVHIVITFFY